jgi:hypothetical protein
METVNIPDTKLVRDIHSKALLNTDRAGLNDYLMKKELAKKQIEEHNESKMRLAKLEEDMNELKSLMREIASMRKV